MVNLMINNRKISVSEGTTILEAAKQHNILIPSFLLLGRCASGRFMQDLCG